MPAPTGQLLVETAYEPLVRELNLDADRIFNHPDIKVWRDLPDRENCTLDAALLDGRRIRLHIKRYKPPILQSTNLAEVETNGIHLLLEHQVPTVPLVAAGRLPDGGSFVITEDLTGYESADKLIEKGLAFEKIARPIADLAAKLHSAGLHHRDLYLCHFFVRRDPLDVRLIDAARVKRLPSWPLRRRWIVKDLAQLWYSMTQLQLSELEMHSVLDIYARSRRLKNIATLKRRIQSKSNRIARHDRKLNEKQPNRNISIPANKPRP